MLPRQQTLKATVDWSYALLTRLERLALQRLSVFAGSWSLEDAEGVISGEDLNPSEVLDLISGLADKSLIHPVSTTTGINRYRLLETIRQYAHERLVESGGVAEQRERHLDFYLALSLQADIELRGKDQREWLKRIDEEIDNFRTAVEWALSNSIEKGLRLAAGLAWYWGSIRGPVGVEWLERLLAAEAGGPDEQRAQPSRQAARGKALFALAGCANAWGRDTAKLYGEAAAIFEKLGDDFKIDLACSLFLGGQIANRDALMQFRKIGDPYYIALALDQLVAENLRTGDLAEARALAEQCLELNRRIGLLGNLVGNLHEIAELELLDSNPLKALELFNASRDITISFATPFQYETIYIPWIAVIQGHYAEADRGIQEAIDATRELGLLYATTFGLGYGGWNAWASGDYDLADRRCHEALQFAGQVSDDLLIPARYASARLAITMGEYEQALGWLKYLLNHWTGNVQIRPIQLVIHTFGILAAAVDRARRAAVLFGAVDFIHKNLMAISSLAERDAYDQALTGVRGNLGEAEFAIAFSQGQAMDLQQVITYISEEDWG